MVLSSPIPMCIDIDDNRQEMMLFLSTNAISVIPELQECLKSVQDWIAVSKLKHNPDKTEFIILAHLISGIVYLLSILLHSCYLQMRDFVGIRRF